MSAIDAVRELHSPDGDSWLRCRGCDVDGFESEDPAWPCRTAALVYTAEEIADITEAARWFGKWDRQMRHRNPAPARSFAKWMEDAFAHAFARLSADSGSLHIPTPSGRVVTASVVAHRMNVSKQLLEDVR